MLKEILSRFSRGELAQSIGQEIIEEFEEVSGRELKFSDLIEAVTVLHGYEQVTNQVLRRRLIDRMTSEEIKKVLSNLGGEYLLGESQDEYEVLNYCADKAPLRFAESMGLFTLQYEVSKAKGPVQGIEEVHAVYPLYPYQQKMVNKINLVMAKEDNSGKRCLLHLPTGAGKTRTAMNFATEHLRANEKGLVLWLADTAELCNQAAGEFKKAWTALGNRDLKLYSYYSDTNISLGGIDSGFIVAGLQKLNSTKSSAQYKILYKHLGLNVSLIIFDEAHKAIAPTYAEMITDITSTRPSVLLLGLSATPGRKILPGSEEDERLSKFFSGQKITMNIAGYESPIKYLVEQNYLAKAVFKNINYDAKKIVNATNFENKKQTDEVKKILSEDKERNAKLLEVIEEEYASGSSIIVFACSVSHSRMLASLLSFKGVKAHSLDSKHDTDETRRYKISDYRDGNVRVLVNYNILTAGFDVPRTNVAIIARPTDSLVQYSQMAGRAMRGKKSGGNDKCRIYTVRDDIPAFTSVAEAFSHWDKLWQEV